MARSLLLFHSVSCLCNPKYVAFTFANIVTFACKAMPYNLSSFHHSEEPIWIFGCSGLPIDGGLCCHFGGVCAPGSCVVSSAMLLLQGHCKTAGTYDVYCACTYIYTYRCVCVYVHVFVCMHVCACACDVLSSAFMHLCIYFAVPHCSSRVVNCPGGSMFCC